MPYTMEDFVRDFTREHLKDLMPEELLEGLPPEQRLKGLSPEQQLAALSPEAKALLRAQLQKDEPPTSPG
jgi:hypothetical protein